MGIEASAPLGLTEEILQCMDESLRLLDREDCIIKGREGVRVKRITVGDKAPIRLGSANMSLNDESWRHGPGYFRNTMSTAYET